jgi:outer membrane protein OmpA-like peptidoglycan-associated protein
MNLLSFKHSNVLALLRRIRVQGALLFLVLAGAAMAQAAQMQDKPGGRDHEVVGRYAGSVLVNYGRQEHEQIEAPLGPMRLDDKANMYVADKSLKAEGRLFHYFYWAPEGRSSLEVYRNYEHALQDKGFTIVFACEQPQQCQQMGLQHYASKWTGAGSTFSSFSPLSRIEDNGNYPPRYLVARRESPESDLYVTLTVRDSGDTQKEKGYSSPYYLQVLEVKKMRLDAVQVLDAKAIEGELERAGKAVFHGINFDTDSAAIRPDSQAQLQQMAAVLKSQPKLKVFIVGHTDNVGAYEHNRGLSQRRAQSVVDVLAAQGIDKTRMLAAGVANVAPLASNANEAGRAKNRRVEMVLQ